MSTRRWLGHAKNVTQVDTVTIANTWATGDTITLTIDNIDVVVTIGALVTTSQVATTLKEAFMGTTLTDTTASCTPTIADGGAISIAQFSEFTATVSSSDVTFKANTSGKPITMTCAENTAGTGTATLANTTVATGKKFFSNQDNWSGNTVPVDTDTIVFDQGDVDCCYGLSPAIQPTIFIRTSGYTGKIGLAEVNTDNTSKPYREYRTKYLTFDDNGGATCTYTLDGGYMTRIDAGAGLAILDVRSGGTRSISTIPVVTFIGTNTANQLIATQATGDVGIAYFEGEAAGLAVMKVGSESSAVTVVCGSGVTFSSAAIDIAGGTVSWNSATTSGTIDVTAGAVTILGGAQPTINMYGGTMTYESTGTITTLKVYGATFQKLNMRGCTITNVIQLYEGAVFYDRNGMITYTAGFKVNGCSLEDVTINVGPDRTHTVA